MNEEKKVALFNNFVQASLAELPVALDKKHDELALLGACLRRPEAFYAFSNQIDAEDFYEPLHAATWAAFQKIITTTPPRTIARNTTFDAMDANPNTPLHGDELMQFISGLATAVPDVNNIRHYAEEVHNAALQGRVQNALTDMRKLLLDSEVSLPQKVAMWDNLLLAATARKLVVASDIDAIGEKVQKIMKRLRSEQYDPGVLFGMDVLDTMVKGILNGEVCYVVGQPGSGKTTWAATVAYNVATEIGRRIERGDADYDKHIVVIFSQELSQEEYLHKLLAIQSGVPSDLHATPRQQNPMQWEATMKSLPKLRELRHRVHIIDEFQPLTPFKFYNKIKRLQAEGYVIELAIIDSIKHVRIEGKENWDEWKHTKAASWLLKMMVRKNNEEFANVEFDGLKVPLLCTHQFRGEFGQDAKRPPTQYDVAGGTAVRENAHTILGLYNPAFLDPNEVDEDRCYILKRRRGTGGRGVGQSALLHFDLDYERYSSGRRLALQTRLPD